MDPRIVPPWERMHVSQQSLIFAETATQGGERTSWSLRRKSTRTKSRPAMRSLPFILKISSSRVRLPGCAVLGVGYAAYHGWLLPSCCADDIFSLMDAEVSLLGGTTALYERRRLVSPKKLCMSAPHNDASGHGGFCSNQSLADRAAERTRPVLGRSSHDTLGPCHTPAMIG